MRRYFRHPTQLAFAAFAACLTVLFLAAGAFSQEAVSTKQPSLDSVRLDFHAALRETAKPLTELQDQYANRLSELQKKVGEAGDLDAALEVKTELENFRSTLTPESKVSVELRQSQKIYRDALSRRRGEFQRNVKPVLSGYRGQLAELEGQLTAAGSLEEAVEVREERERIEGLLATDLARAAIDLGVLDEGNDPAKSVRVIVRPAEASTVADVKKLRPQLPASTNRPYYYTGIPDEFIDFDVLRMEVRGNLSYSYEVQGKCQLYLLVHKDNLSNGSAPEDEKWKKTEHTVVASGGFFVVYEKDHNAGKYTLSTQGPWPYVLMTEGSIEIRND